MKINCGCSILHVPGYLNIDINPEVKPDRILDCLKMTRDDFPGEIIEEIRAWHLLEHLPVNNQVIDRDYTAILKHWYDLLVPGGWLKISMPNIQLVIVKYFDLINNPPKADFNFQEECLLREIYGLHTSPWEIHHMGFSKERAARIMEMAGFRNLRYGVELDRDAFVVEGQK